MKNLLHTLDNLGAPVSKLVKQPICDDKGNTLAWNFFVQNSKGISVAGGTHVDPAIAKRISIAEALERALAGQISRVDHLTKEFLLDKYPTSCGFACGFEKAPTKMRALREATERWAWSMWIDKSFTINRLDKKNIIIDPLSKFIFEHFSNVQLFQKDDILIPFENEIVKYSFLVLILETDLGVFAGCRAGMPGENLLSHAAIEAFR
ncbi:MAG TPA: hypothetical protein VIG33_16025, partial [Pseudobdellovibrionaceae bacterium]